MSGEVIPVGVAEVVGIVVSGKDYYGIFKLSGLLQLLKQVCQGLVQLVVAGKIAL